MNTEQIKYLIRQAAQKHGVNEDLALAVAKQESGYQPGVVSHAGAIGVMQLMPETAKGLGVSDPYDAAQNIDGGVRYLKAQLDAFKGDTSLALAAYNAGAGNVQKYGGIPPFEETQNYVKNILGSLQTGGSSPFLRTLGENLGKQKEAERQPEFTQTSQPVMKEEASFDDRFLDAYHSSIIYGSIRERNMALNNPADNTWHPSQEDYTLLQEELKDPSLAYHIAVNAQSPQHMQALLQARKVDKEREERIEASDIGWRSLGTLAGLLIDPINLIPIAGAGGKAFSAAKYLKMGIYNALLNTADRAAFEKITGRQQSLAMAGLFGGLAGAMLPLGADLGLAALGKTKMKAQGAAQRFINKIDNVMDTTDLFDISRVAHVADNGFVRAFNNSKLTELFESGNNFILARKDAIELSKHIGIDLADNARAFHAGNNSFYIRETIKDAHDLEKLIFHEQGVHGGLAKMVGKDAWEDLKGRITTHINNNPPDTLLRAVNKAQGAGDIEEVAGHWIEEILDYNKKHPILATLKKGMDRTRRALGIKGDISEQEFEGIVRGSLDQLQGKGYQALSNGAAIVDGIKYSADNPVNPRNLEKAIELTSPFSQGADYIGKKLQGWSFTATPYLTFQNSKSKALKGLADALLHDPLLSSKGTAKYIPIEMQKAWLKTEQLDKFKVLSDTITELVVDRGTMFGGKLTPDTRHTAWKQITQLFDAEKMGKKIDPTPLERKALDALAAFRELQIEHAKTSASRFGYDTPNFVPEDWAVTQDGMTRVVNNEARTALLALYPDDAKAITDLTELGYAGAQRFRHSHYQKVLQERLDNEYIEALSKWEATGRQEIQPVKPEVNDQMLSEYIREEARKWATGIIDENLSTVRTDNVDTSGQLDFMRHRFVMDTSVEIKNSFGTIISFDEHLRSYDFDTLLPKMIDRMTGEITLSNFFNKKYGVNFNALGNKEFFQKSIDNTRLQVEKELTREVSRGVITNRRKQKELDTFDFVIRKLRGISDGKPIKTIDALQGLFSKLAYARNGGNMGFNQLGEISGAIAYQGFNSVLDLIPYAGRLIKEIKYGKNRLQLAQEMSRQFMGETIEDAMFRTETLMSSSRFKRADTPMAGVLDGVDHVANISAAVTSSMNGLVHLTQKMIKSTRVNTMLDTLAWVEGKQPSFIRNPFSKTKLKAAGIDPSKADEFKALIKKYISTDASGELSGFDFNMFHKEHPIEASKLYMMVKNQSMRAIQQVTLGNTNMLRESSWFYKMLFQFKNFTMMATQGQTLRALKNHEVDDLMSAMWSLCTNGALVAGLGVARAYAYYGDDEAKRDEYIENYLNPKSLMLNAFLRSPVTGAGLSTPNDIYEVLSGSPTIRTTTANTRQGKSILEGDIGHTLGRSAGQLPTLKTAGDFLKVPASVLVKGISDEDYMTQKDLSSLMQLLPMQNFVPLLYLRNEFVRQTDLPKK